MAEWMRRVGASTADLLFPRQCVGCRGAVPDEAPEPTLCPRCRASLVDEASVPCPRCAAPLPEQLHRAEHCPHCRTEKFAFDGAIALGVYDGLLRETVLRMKLPFEEPLTITVGRILADRIARRVTLPPDLAAPVPMHWTRRLVRKVNCPEVLAETVARRLRIPDVPDLLALRRRPLRQHTLTPSERRRNMRGALAIRKGYDIRGARVLLVDDALTTGATAHAAARALKKAGASEVIVAVVARGVGA